MKSFGTKKPVLFELLLFIIAMAAAVILGVILGNVNEIRNMSMALSRIIVTLILLVIFRKCFRNERPLAGIGYALPALLLAAWNAACGLAFGGKFELPDAEVIILSAAPAVFEEVLFRGILISNLKENGKSDMSAMMISAVFFGLVHLTNIVGMSLPNTLIQTGYATVIGLLFGAVYLKKHDILSVMIMHGLIDLSSHMFVNRSTVITPAMLAAFAGILLLVVVYSFVLTKNGREDSFEH